MSKPEPGKQYRLTGGPGVACISNGDSWAASEVGGPDLAAVAIDAAALTRYKATHAAALPDEDD